MKNLEKLIEFIFYTSSLAAKMNILNDRPNLLFLIWIRTVFMCKNHTFALVTRMREPLFRRKILKILIYKIVEHGNQYWYVNDKLHREDGPAIICANDDQYWYVNDNLHREDGPAVIYANGDQEWYVNGKLHRKDGPAVTWADGYKVWYINGKRHRTDGPAVICANGDQEWWINSKIIERPEN